MEQAGQNLMIFREEGDGTFEKELSEVHVIPDPVQPPVN